MKILVVEDEEMMRKILTKGLNRAGYAVDTSSDGEEALEMFAVNAYDLIVLDLSIPKIDGMEVLRRIRRKDKEVKVLILSARSEITDRIMGLDAGSNDYLTKPFDFHELEARIRCLLRRSFVQQDTIITYQNLVLDTAKHSIQVEKQEVELTKKEYSILEYLLYHVGEVISAEQLIEHVWDSEADLFSNSFKFHMSSLKKKLSNKGATLIIRNLRGQGYIIDSLIEKGGKQQ